MASEWGGSLSLPEEAGVATVRVRGGEMLVTDGPFVETKEFVAGIELFEALDLEEAISVEAKNPVVRFNPFEIRPLPDAFRVGPKLTAFENMDDADGVPYLLTVWVEGMSIDAVTDPAVAQRVRGMADSTGRARGLRSRRSGGSYGVSHDAAYA